MDNKSSSCLITDYYSTPATVRDTPGEMLAVIMIPWIANRLLYLQCMDYFNVFDNALCVSLTIHNLWKEKEGGRGELYYSHHVHMIYTQVPVHHNTVGNTHER